MVKIAIIRIRGGIGIETHIKDTLHMLQLHKKNYCAVFEGTSSRMGMIKKVKDYITWGEIDDATLKSLTEKKMEMKLTKEGKKIPKPFFRLNPPRGGYGRKGIKKSFSIGGGLGNRKEKINLLISKML